MPSPRRTRTPASTTRLDQAIVGLKTPKQSRLILRLLFSETDLQSAMKRLYIAQLISDGRDNRDILDAVRTLCGASSHVTIRDVRRILDGETRREFNRLLQTLPPFSFDGLSRAS